MSNPTPYRPVQPTQLAQYASPNQSQYAQPQPAYGQPNYAPPVQPVYPQPTASYGRNPSDTGSFGWAVLGFFIPLVGLILWMIWKNDRPGDAGMAGKGALVSMIINVVLFILWIVFAGILFAASGSY